MITNILYKRGRSARKGRPRFGKHYYMGAHRYVYYMNGRPQYYFSDRPYTIKDAIAWKRRGLISAIIILLICLSFLFEFNMTEFGSVKVPLFVVDLCLVVFSIILTITFIRIHPEDDPMLESFQCSSDLERPPVDTCKNCGGQFSHGAHTVCPHCKAQIKTSGSTSI